MSRRQLQPVFDRHGSQAARQRQHGLSPVLVEPGLRPVELVHNPEVMDIKLAAQVREMERLVGENRKLATTNVAMGQDLGHAKQEVKHLKEHIQSIQTESDIQIRVLMDKIAKSEADIKAGESVKKELQQAHLEVHDLFAARQELTAEIQQASEELQKACDDVKKLSDMQAELESVRKEHQKLRVMFEYEKGLNIKEVEQMKAMEREMIGTAREIEKLRAEILNVKMRANVSNPYSGRYINPNSSFRHPVYDGSNYGNEYGAPSMQLDVCAPEKERTSYGSSNGPEAVERVGSEARQSASESAV